MLRNADPPDAGQSMIVMPLSGPGGRSTAREAASLPFATLATTAELHAVQSSSGGGGAPLISHWYVGQVAKSNHVSKEIRKQRTTDTSRGIISAIWT